MGGGSSNTAREAHVADRWVSSFYKRRPLVAGEDVRAAARSPSLLICKKSHIIHQKEVSSEDKVLCGAAGRIQSQRLGTDVVGGPGLLVQKMCSPCKLTCGSWSSQASACCLDRRPPGTLSHTPLPLARERKPAPTPGAPRPPAPAPWATQLCPRQPRGGAVGAQLATSGLREQGEL